MVNHHLPCGDQYTYTLSSLTFTRARSFARPADTISALTLCSILASPGYSTRCRTAGWPCTHHQSRHLQHFFRSSSTAPYCCSLLLLTARKARIVEISCTNSMHDPRRLTLVTDRSRCTMVAFSSLPPPDSSASSWAASVPKSSSGEGTCSAHTGDACQQLQSVALLAS